MTELTTPTSMRSFSELPFHMLLGQTFDEMTDEEMLNLARSLKEERTSPVMRKAKIKRESDTLSGKKSKGKPTIVNVDDLL